MDLLDSYPLDASGGADFFSGAAPRDISRVDPEGRTYLARERVVVMGRVFEYGAPVAPGRACLSETTIRHLGHLVGLYDEVEMQRAQREIKLLTRENDVLSLRVAALERECQALRDASEARIVYVSPDGAEHGSMAAMRRHLNLDQPEVPEPLPQEVAR